MRGSLTICILLSGIALSCGGQTRLGPEGADGAPRAETGPIVVEGGLSSDATEGSFDGDDDAASCYISVSNYDQSCTVSSDCVVRIVEPDASTGGFIVQSGNYCKPMCICGGEAINNGAVAQYVADVSKTPLGSGAIRNPLCFCTSVSPTACCSDAGRCIDHSCPL